MEYEKPMDYEKPSLFPIDVEKAQGHCDPLGQTDGVGQCKDGGTAALKCATGTNPDLGAF